MNEKPLNANYSFAFGGMNFSVDIDDSLDFEYRLKKYPVFVKNALHYHSLHEIFFVFDSSLKITFEDGEREYKNCIVCLPPQIKHFAHRTLDYRILFSCSKKEQTDEAFTDFFTKKFASDGIFCISDITPKTKVYLEELRDLFYEQKNKVTKECIIARLKLIFYHIFNCATAPEKEDDPYTQSNYITIDRLISQCTSPSINVSLENIANELHLSEKQTSRLIHKYYGKSLPTLITEGKLDYAAYLLTYTDMQISEVAASSNFNSENHFFAVFKKRFGTTPLSYRKEKMNV